MELAASTVVCTPSVCKAERAGSADASNHVDLNFVLAQIRLFFGPRILACVEGREYRGGGGMFFMKS